MTNHSDVWRDPDEETVGLYPNLVVHDGRVTGSITIGKSRLPLWAILHTAWRCGWDEVEDGWEPTASYGFTEDDFVGFVYNLLEMRGEFGRLLLVLANAERVEQLERDAVLEPHGGLVNVTPGDPEAVVLPPPWYRQPAICGPIAEQLRRCLECIT